MITPVEKYLKRFNVEPSLFLTWLEATIPKVEDEVRTNLREITSIPSTEHPALDQRRSSHILNNISTLEALVISKKILADANQGKNIQNLDNSALEAVIRQYKRPALLVLGGQVEEPNTPEWHTTISEHKDIINKTISSVGRIELEGHPDFVNLATAFLVAEDIIMTNVHVVNRFRTDKLQFRPGIKAFIDYKGYALPQEEEEEYEVKEIISIHPLYDLALLKISRTDGTRKPLSITGQEPPSLNDTDVYVCGYPSSPRPIESEIANVIFGGLYGVKRVSPGKSLGFHTYNDNEDMHRKNIEVLAHDCSTIQGNSGSPLIDLHNNTVIGLHFYGTFMERNIAVPLWKLIKDPMLANSGIEFIM